VTRITYKNVSNPLKAWMNVAGTAYRSITKIVAPVRFENHTANPETRITENTLKKRTISIPKK